MASMGGERSVRRGPGRATVAGDARLGAAPPQSQGQRDAASASDSACACGGGCARCAGGAPGALIARTPQPGAMGTMGTTTSAAPTAQDYRDYVSDTTTFFNGLAGFYGNPQVALDAARIDSLIDSWYAMVVDRETMIRDHLNGDVLLDRALQAAYIGAIRALMTRAATVLSKTEDELYRVNSGRIPMWAWPSPHRQETDISTPLDQGQAVDPLSGNVSYTTPTGIAVEILADTVDAGLSQAETSLQLPFSVPFTSNITRAGEFIATATPSPPKATLQSRYPSSGYAGGTSGYGRGTTAEDRAGGRVDPRSTTVRWHEGNHGLDFERFLAANPLPVFPNVIGLTRAQFNTAVAGHRAALGAYVARAQAATSAVTHCVGTTIDQYNQANAAPGATVRTECAAAPGAHP